MTGDEIPSGQGNNGFGPVRETGRHRLLTSRAFLIAAALTVAVVTVVTTLTVMAAGSSGDSPVERRAPLPDRSETSAEPTPTPTPRPEFAEDPGSAGSIEAAAGPASSVVESPKTAASSWSASPVPVEPVGAPPAASGAEALAAQANAAYGVNILIEGQNWGDSEAAQVNNVQAVVSAIERLPDTVISAVVSHPHGPLTFVSNNQGRTLEGWQPYGGHPMTYYTNSDQGPGGHHASNQVVLNVGAGSLSIGHEILHAYQCRNVGPDEYALALLQPEMKSFMAATGWQQMGSDAQVRAAVNQPWTALNGLYVYAGRPFTYESTSGGTGSITADNPIEAFAVAGSIYYTPPSWMQLPDWPEYWGWFDSNVG
ncbi:MAG: hypothetical protein WD379_01575 [Dehalococcoidia bacterium]